MMTVPLYAIGAKGVISVLANAYPVIFRKIKEYSLEGNYSKATQEALKILDINPLMYEESNPVGLKTLLEEMGICTGAVRLPLVQASESLRSRIRSIGSSR